MAQRANGSISSSGGGGSEQHLYQFTGVKAGMDGVDREHVERVIHAASAHSAYYAQAQRQAQRVTAKLAHVSAQLQRIGPAQQHAAQRHAVRDAVAALHAMPTHRTFICVDMDMFFAAVAMRDDASLAHKPVAVGDASMISTANYEARRFGVRSAMPGFIAKKLCPHLVFVKTDFPKYKEIAAQIRAIFAEYDADFRSCSLDEASLDVTDYLQGRNRRSEGDGRGGEACNIDGNAVAAEIRSRIFERVNLTASAGIACNRMLAKICSDFNKPNGQYCLPSDKNAIKEFMDKLPTRKIPGIGRVSERVLKELGVQKCGDIVARTAYLRAALTRRHVDWLIRVSVGVARSSHDAAAQPRKSVSVSRTFPGDSCAATLEQKLRQLCEQLGSHVQRNEVSGKTVTVTMKSVDFRVRQRCETLPYAISTPEELFDCSLRILKSEMPLHLRLLGVKLSSLDSCAVPHVSSRTPTAQLTLFQCFPSIAKNRECNDRGRFHIDSSNARDLTAMCVFGADSSDIVQCDQLERCTEHSNSDGRSVENHASMCDSSQLRTFASAKLRQTTDSITGFCSGERELSWCQSKAEKLCPVCLRHIPAASTPKLLNAHINQCLDSTETSLRAEESFKRRPKTAVPDGKRVMTIDKFFKPQQRQSFCIRHSCRQAT